MWTFVPNHNNDFLLYLRAEVTWEIAHTQQASINAFPLHTNFTTTPSIIHI